MTQVHLHAKDISTLTGQTLVVFSKAASQKDKPAKITHTETAKALAETISDKIVSGSASEAISFREARFLGFRHVICVGLGAESKISAESVRQAAAALIKEVKSLKTTEAFVHFDGVTASKKESAEFMQAFVEGLHLASYSFDELKSSDKKTKEDIQIHMVTKSGKDKAIAQAFHEGTILAACSNFAKRLGDMPGNLMTPTALADEAIRAAKGTALKVTAWDKKRIEKEKMGGLLGVAAGSAQEPRFIVMEYFGAAKTKKPIAFVGKGLTFDTGGISIKPSAKMEEMKYDMCGGAAVIGTMLAISQLKLKINAVAYVPATENMPGSRATKPGDVHTARNGKTFEINNTDAEGRLILSDALCYASEQKPEIIIDTATLTGAIVVALGNVHTGYFTRNSPLKSKIEKAATKSGELVWNMPLTDYHVKDMKGTFADLSNVSSANGAGSATAAAFLEQFVGEGIPWAHFDIAGTAWACGNRLNYCSAKGATGVMVRTFVEIAKQY
ncbi:MAG: aminopeptidase [Bdellovibrionales bacterium RIFCSPHIGHO2_01_FULL_40_29]|nr:MAG: aminopeptidase [Bdellovibrionales bacterium RIFCSPHIGHO2_01_FULL_40_29]OFZ34796.1 MAG: aminopeptidase [Bdellovibrionales bacterium RIFCSPHIGHO2_02_FULL_40_15]